MVAVNALKVDWYLKLLYGGNIPKSGPTKHIYRCHPPKRGISGSGPLTKILRSAHKLAVLECT